METCILVKWGSTTKGMLGEAPNQTEDEDMRDQRE